MTGDFDFDSEPEAVESRKPKRVYKPRTPHATPAPTPAAPPVAPPPPLQFPQQPPNPNIAAMENKVMEMVEYRTRVQMRIAQVMGQLGQLQGALAQAKEEFQRIGQEIEYRLAMIDRMRGVVTPQAPLMPYATATTTAPPANYGYSPQPAASYPPAAPMPWDKRPQSPTHNPMVPLPDYPPQFDPRMPVGSFPANNRGLYPDLVGGPDGEQTADATEIRYEEMRNRGY